MFLKTKTSLSSFTTILIYMLPVVLLLAALVTVCNSHYITRNVADISDRWHYYTDHDETRKPVQLPCKTMGIYPNENCYLTSTLHSMGNNAAIMFKSEYLRIVAEVDGKEIYRYGHEETASGSPGKKLVLIPLPENYTGREITLILTPTMNLRAYSIYMGDPASLMSYAVVKSAPAFIMGVLVFLLGIVLVCVYLIQRKEGKAVTADFWFGLFVISVGLYFPGKTFLFLILLDPMEATLLLMIANYLMPCFVMLFVYASCKRFRFPVLTAFFVHVAGYLPVSLMQIFSDNPPTGVLAVFMYLVPVYYMLCVFAFIKEILTGKRNYKRLTWAGSVLIIMIVFDKINSMTGNFMHYNDVETLTKVGLFLFITIEVTGRINDYFRENAQVTAELRTSQEKTRIALEHFNDIEQYMDEVHALNHDINHHFNALKALTDQGDLDRTREYLNSLTGSYPATKQVVYTKNKLLNHIMAYTAREAEKNDINLTHSISLPGKIAMGDSDFYSLFINIVDNALEACSAMKSNDDRTIELACSMKNGFMHVMCRNSKENAVLVDEGRYVSTKTGNIKHGLGLGIIERIVEKYNGVMDIEHDRDWFVIKLALLPSQP